MLLIAIAAIYTTESLYEPAFNLFAQNDGLITAPEDSTGLPVDTTNGGEVQTDNPTDPVTVKDASQMFNERGFSRSSSINFDGSEVINDFNGNLMYEIPLYQYKISNNLDFNMKLTYNGCVNHEVFLADTSYCLNGNKPSNRYNINAPEWIVSVNGIAVQVMNFETRFLSKPNSNGVSGPDLKKLIPGYHYSDGLKALSASDYDRIFILAGDGSTISLINKTANQYIGTYYSDEKGSHIKAVISFDTSDPAPNPWKKRKMDLFMGDGLIYSFNENEIKFYDLGVEYARKPMAFFLQNIRDQFGNTIGINYQHLNSQWGRDVFDAASGIKFNYNFNGIIIDDYSGETGRYKLHFSDFAAYTETIQGSKIPMLSIITNPLQQQTVTDYESYSRNLSNLPCNYSNLGTINISANDLRRIKTIKNFLGGEREYEYFSPAVSSLEYINSDIPLRTTGSTFKGSGRDPFFCNMLSSKKDIDNTDQKCLTEFIYEFVDSNTSFNQMPADQTDYYSTQKNFTSLDGKTVNISQGNSILNEYKFYPVKNYGIIINEFKDLGSVNKLIREKTLKPDNSTFEETHFEYEKGTYNVYFNGSFLTTKKTTTTGGLNRVWDFSYTYKNSSFDSLITQKTEIDPLGNKLVTDFINIEQVITFLDNQRLKSQTGGNLTSFGNKLFYKNGLESIVSRFDASNNLRKKTENRYILSENNDSAYFGQLILNKEYAEGSTSNPIEQRYIYYKKDTLAMFRYGTTGLPYVEGNLKTVIKPEGREERYFYYPVYNNENNAGDQGPGGGQGGDLPLITYKIKFSNGNDSIAREYFDDTRFPIRTENYLRTSGGCDTLKRIYTKYNRSGTPLIMIDENKYAARFMYEPKYNRISSITLPGDFESHISVDTTVYIDTNFYFDTLTLVSDSWGTNDELNGNIYFLNNPSYFAPWYNGIGACRCFNTHVECNSSGSIVTKSNAFMKFNGELLPKFVNISFAELRFPVAKYDKIIGGSPAPEGDVVSTLRPFSNLGTVSGFECEGRGISKSNSYTPENSFGSVFDVDTSQGGCNKNQFINITSMLHNYVVGSNKTLKGFDIKQTLGGNFNHDTPPQYVFKLYCVPCNTDWVSWRDNNIPRLKIYGKIDASDTLKKVSSNGATFRYEYNDDNRTVTVKSIMKNSSPVKEKRVKYHFDGFGNIKRKDLYNADFSFDSLLYRFNFLNKPARNYDGTGDTTMFSYDFAGRQIKTKNADTSSSTVSYSYQSGISGHLAGYTGFVEKQAFTDETGRTFNKYFDAVGNLLREEKFVAGDGNGNVQELDNPFDPDTTILGDTPPQQVALITDYQYDALYRLIKVRTPEGKIIQYWYDGYGRQIQRNTVDAGLTKYSYDLSGNLVLSQDAKQRNTAYNLFTGRTYDGLNRLLTIGDVKQGNMPPPIGGDNPGGGSGDTTVPSQFDFPQSADSLYVINVYDTLSNSLFSSLFDASKPYDLYSTRSNNTKGKLISTAFRTNLADSWSFKYYQYDERGRILRFWQKLAGMDSVKAIDYKYNSQNQMLNLSYQRGRNDWKFFAYNYDDAARLKNAGMWYFNGSDPVEIENDSVAVPEDTEADYPGGEWLFKPYVNYTYNHEQQVDSLVLNAGINPLVYRFYYNNRNWLNYIKRPSGNSEFLEYLTYNLNGNIRQLTTGGLYTSHFGNNEALNYTYIYDNSNRLLKADEDSIAASQKSYDLIMNYDKDGNITRMKRYGGTENVVDTFGYEYYNGTNRLKKVSPEKSQEYVYDGNGNVIADSLNHNYQLKYDWRNLITELRFWEPARGIGDGPGGGIDATTEKWVYKTNYWYDEAGNRICKKTAVWIDRNGNPVGVEDVSTVPDTEGDGPGGGSWLIQNTVYYVRDAGGKEIAIYNGNSIDQWNLFGNDQVGEIKANNDRHFYLKDHLGTIRVVLDSNNAIIAANDYDAWGYPLENRSYSAGSFVGKYQFTGKERDKESGSGDNDGYDYFGARYYDSRIGRWNGVEPLLDKYVGVTPYCYGLCNPIFAKDINGFDVYFYGTDVDKLAGYLDEKSKLHISIENGKLKTSESSIEGVKTEADKLLWNAINKSDFTVNLYSNDNNPVNGIRYWIAGQWGGNDGKTASQYVSISDIELLSDIGYSSEGESVMHEILEAFIGVSYGKRFGDAHLLTKDVMNDKKPDIIPYQSEVKNNDPGIISGIIDPEDENYRYPFYFYSKKNQKITLRGSASDKYEAPKEK